MTDQIALNITERLFSEAPLYLKTPQTAELAKLSLKQLVFIAQITQFPLEPTLREKIVTALKGEKIIERMERRSMFLLRPLVMRSVMVFTKLWNTIQGC